jgi:hypothetical protein
MERITIEVADDGLITVVCESPEKDARTSEYDNVTDATEYVRDVMVEATGESDAEKSEYDAAEAWDEEANSRAQKRAQEMSY